VEVLSKADGDKPLTRPKEIIPDPEVLFSDAEVILADKPAGLLSVATDRGEVDTMYDRVAKWAWENGRTRTHLVHRLDRETSGCMIFARSAETKDMLQKQFKNRSVERIYHAVVHGKPPADSGVETLQKTSEYAWLRMEEEVVERRLQIGGSRKKGQLTASSASK
jgi:23S rRNA-/tRNA-specific pseudouridylate synthase